MPSVAGRAVVVSGLADLQRAWSVADRETGREFRDALRAAAEPVRVDAQRLALASIPKVTLPWARMRVGVTRRSVYVAPRHRGTRNRNLRRPNFAEILMGRAMRPALNLNISQVERKVGVALQDVGRKWESV